MIVGSAEQFLVTTPAGIHLADKFAGKFSGANFTQRFLHSSSHRAVDNSRTGRKRTPSCRVRNQRAHSGDPGFVDKIDNELKFVEAFEVGQLGRITGAYKRIESRANKFAGSA